MALGFQYGRIPFIGLRRAATEAELLISQATVLNDYSPTFARASTAYDPYNRVTASSGSRRRRPLPISKNLTVFADLIENSRTNLCVRSNDFNNWGTKTDVTITTAAYTPSDGTGTADRILEGSAGTAAVLSAAMTITAGRIVTANVRFKFKATNNWVMITVASDALANGWRVWANINTGAIGTQSAIGTGGVAGTAQLLSLGNGEYQLISSGTVAAAATACQIQVNSASGDTSTTRVNAADYYAWGSQVEMMAASATTGFPSSYIATTTATVTRSRDDLDIAYAFPQIGTILALCIPYGWTGDQDGVTFWRLYNTNDTAGSGGVKNTATNIAMSKSDNGGTLRSANFAHGLTNGQLTQLALTWTAGVPLAGYKNGVLGGGSAATTGPFDANTTVRIGGLVGGGQNFFGWVALLAWPRALTADELLALYGALPVAA